MARHNPADVLKDFDRAISRSQGLASAAQQWIVRANGPQKPRFTIAYRDMLTELAFLHIFLAWERFLEESFLLYMLGKKSPHKYAPQRFVTPPTRAHAFQLTLPERGRPYAEWDNAEVVRERAQRFFKKGDPYESVLSAHTHLLKEIQTIRNAIVHRSISSRDKFDTVVRNNLGYLPSKLPVGNFLIKQVRGQTVPISYLDSYINKLTNAARDIIP
ncbi:hypothetical protein L0337_28035 [candidate division KSB1 bacterium]|nr:hypothetical protein [candidate division KSB1 bacterium]